MGVRSVAGLEFSNPEIGQEREGSPSSRQESVKMAFEFAAINRPIIMIRAAELRAQDVSRVNSSEPEPGTGLVREPLQSRTGAVRRGRFLAVEWTFFPK